MALKVVLALAVVALAAADDSYEYDTPLRSFSHFAPVRAVQVSSEEDDGYKYQQPARTFTHRATESSEEDDGYKYQEPVRTFTHRAPVRIARPKNAYVAPVKTYVAPVKTYVAPVKTYVAPVKTYVAPAKPVAKYIAPVTESSEEDDGYDYQQPARTFSHRPPVRVAAPVKPKNTYVAPKSVNTYKAPAQTYKAPESDEVLDYAPTNPEYNQRYQVSDDETGAAFEHEEERDGAQTRGSYSVNLPDGRVQTVTYYVNGDGGFVAEVTYQGEAQYPAEPEGGYGPWTGAIASPTVVRGEYSAPASPRDKYGAPSAPRRKVVAYDSSEEIQTPRGLYKTPRA